ncbi:MAG: hypothetical protein GY854_15350 [Deltaproteobacteria bacterium]|nr:hypothetical protein [Deltaproteobacteria bacterium]
MRQFVPNRNTISFFLAIVSAGCVWACSSCGNPGEGTAAAPSDTVAGNIDGDPTEGRAWVFDDSLWTPLEGAAFTRPKCQILEAFHKNLAVAPLQWTACGHGCSWADITQGISQWATYPLASTIAIDGNDVAYLKVVHGVTYDKWRVRLLRVIRLNDGVTIGAIKGVENKDEEWIHCNFMSTSALGQAILGGGDAESGHGMRVLRGRTTTDGGPWRWALPALEDAQEPPSYHTFDSEYDGGRILRVGGGGVYIVGDMKSSEWSVLERPSGSRIGASQGNLVVWTDHTFAASPSVRGWTDDGAGVRTIIEKTPDKTSLITITQAAIIGKTGSPDANAVDSRARLWMSKRADKTKDVTLRLSPCLSERRLVYRALAGWDDFAALAVVGVESKSGRGFHLKPLSYLLVRLSNWNRWSIHAEKGQRFLDKFTLTGTHLYIVAVEEQDLSKSYARRVYRFDLEHIDDWGRRESKSHIVPSAQQ